MQEDVLERLRLAGIPRIAPQLQDMAREGIHIRTSPVPDAQLTVGTSKIGGFPDLPPAAVWPEWNGIALTFIAQIRLDDVTQYDVQRLLPTAGILYFFYAAEEQRGGGCIEDRGAGRVLYFDGDLSTLTRRNPPPNIPHNNMDAFKACALSFSMETTLPGLQWGLVAKLGMREDERKRYWDLLSDLRDSRWDHPGWYCHRLLGYADEEQGDLQLECEIVTAGLNVNDGTAYKDPLVKARAEDWMLLLQVCSDDEYAGMMWGDAGFIYFMIRRDDLAARNFDNIWVMLQCT